MCHQSRLLSLSIISCLGSLAALVWVPSASASDPLLEEAVAAWQFDGMNAINGDPRVAIAWSNGGCVPNKSAYPVKAPNFDGWVAKDDPTGAGINAYCGAGLTPDSGSPLDIKGTLTMFGRVRYSAFKARNEVWRLGSSPAQLSRMYALEVNNRKARFIVWGQGQTGEVYVSHDTELQTSTWYDITGIFDASRQTIAVYVYDPQTGRQIGSSPTTAVPFNALYDGMSGGNLNWMVLEEPGNGTGINVGGEVELAAIWNRVLTRSQIASLSGGVADASGNPVPSDRATDVPRDVVLSWAAGLFATSHDVYLGASFDDVNTATRTDPKGVLVSLGQADATFDAPGLLAYGQTYYWRVDEVNAPPDNTIYRGDVWSFTSETYGYPVKPVKATASSSSNSLMGPEKTIDGSGLDALDQHGTSASHMWLSKKGTTPIWIKYDFDKVYKLYQMGVWNSNQSAEPDVGYGAKDVTVETSLDGTTWTALGGVVEFAQATGEPNYVHNTTVDFGGSQAKYVRLTITSNWSGTNKQAGLSEVRFFYVPVKAFGPAPASGSTSVAIDSMLNWRPGREAVQHQVYLGADPNNLSLATTTSDHSLALASLSLQYGTTYTWKVNEVNDAATPAAWEGDAWSFTTPDYGVVDNFESYNDQCNRIFFAWVDGFGYSASLDCGVAASPGNGTGSTVGNTNPPFAGTTIVHGGRQSMPLAYDNTGGKGTSEATRTFDVAQDWTLGGVKTLVLFFRGSLDNGPGQLYVTINGTQVAYNGSATALTTSVWKQWNIDLASVSTHLKAVKTLGIGVSGSGKGILYVDDLQLYRVAPAATEPTDPGSNGLMANYRMENDAKDSSGKGNNGTASGDPAYVEGMKGNGNALKFDGIDDYVDLPIGTLLSSLTSSSFTAWVNWSGQNGDWQRIFDFGGPTPTPANPNNYMFLSPCQTITGPMTFAIMTPTVPEKRWVAPSRLTPGWHHVAVVVDATAMNIAVYLDGQGVASSATTVVPKDLGKTTQNWLGRSQWTADAFYTGVIDEFRIYNRALSEGEVRYLAGDR